MTLSSKAMLRRRKTRIERKRANITHCRVCCRRMTVNDIHHNMCNACWRKAHPHEAIIQKKKSGKY